jgi:hypothetical protein
MSLTCFSKFDSYLSAENVPSIGLHPDFSSVGNLPHALNIGRVPLCVCVSVCVCVVVCICLCVLSVCVSVCVHAWEHNICTFIMY